MPPVSTPPELEHDLNITAAHIVITLDGFTAISRALTRASGSKTSVLARIPDYLPPLKAAAFALTQGRQSKVPPDIRVVRWQTLLKGPHRPAPATPARPDAAAAILVSRGTTGWPKAVQLSNRNLIAAGMQTAAWSRGLQDGTMLAILPISRRYPAWGYM